MGSIRLCVSLRDVARSGFWTAQSVFFFFFFFPSRSRFDLGFWYDSAFGSPVGRAQGIGYVQELVARLTKTPIATVRG